MFCSKCGQQINEGVPFCGHCGTPVVMTSYNVPNVNPPKKKIGLFIAVGGVVFVLIIIIIIIFVIFGTRKNQPDEYAQSVQENPQGHQETIIEEAQSDISVSNNESYSQYLENEDYKTVIEIIISTDFSSYSEQDKNDVYAVLEEAVKKQWEQSKATMTTFIENDNVESAYNLYVEERAYIESIQSNDIVASFFDFNEVDNFKYFVVGVYRVWLNEKILENANDGDGEGVIYYLDIANNVMEPKDYTDIYNRAYSLMTIVKCTNMYQGGDDIANILIYLDNQMRELGYACWLIEYWDYYYTVYRSNNNLPGWSTTITHAINGYLLPDSATRLLNTSDLAGLSRYELSLARLEIYARHGRKFTDPKIQEYFNNCSWYSGTTSQDKFEEATLNDIELQNAILILKYEEELGFRGFATMQANYSAHKNENDVRERGATVSENNSSSAKGAKAFAGSWGSRTTNSGTGVVISITVNSDLDIIIDESSVGGGSQNHYIAQGVYDAELNRIEVVSLYCDYDFSYSLFDSNCNPGESYFVLTGEKLVWYVDGRINFSDTKYHVVTN